MMEHPAGLAASGGQIGDQLGLSLASPRPRSRPADGQALSQPVAQVVLDTGLAHLDRPFSYLVPTADDQAAQPGVRVRVRFAGRDHDGYIIARAAASDFGGALTPIARVVSPEPVLTPHLHRVARAVADEYAGTLPDVLRLAIPPRHAAAERALAAAPSFTPDRAEPGESGGGASAWSAYPAGSALLSRLAAGYAPGASWLALPGASADQDWPIAIAEAVAATRRSGRGSVVVVPDHRDLVRVSDALDRWLGPDAHVQLTAEQGPSARYTAWLSLLRGHHDVVVGTRSAAYAPVQRPGLFVLWDEMDDLHREPRSPYPHLREVLRIRAADTSAGLLFGGFVRSVEVAQQLAQGALRSVRASTETIRASTPAITVAGEGHELARDAAAHAARLPSQAWRAISTGVKVGPVLVQVPRRGYVMALRCARCRYRLHCPTCHGPVNLGDRGEEPSCGWCGTAVGGTPCPECGSLERRGAVIGERRTAYEIGRAFPGVEVRSSKAGQVIPTVDDEPVIVVATPGAEPDATHGYAATVLMDGWALLERAGLDAPLEALRRWSAAAALTRGRGDGGQVVLVGVPAHAGVPAVEALLRWDPDWLASRELIQRRDLGLPPLRRVVSFTGEHAALRRVGEQAGEGLGAAGQLEVIGPLGAGAGAQHLLVRPQAVAEGSTHLTAATGERAMLDFTRRIRAERSLAKAADTLRIEVDPIDAVL